VSNIKIAALAVAIIVVALVAYAYFFIISPTFVSKPVVEKVTLAEQPVANNINWAVNELGSFKLHANPLNGEPAVMEIVVTDIGKTFTTTISNNVPSTVEGAATNPDIRLKIASADFAQLYSASDPAAEAAVLYKEGKAQVELLKDTTTLAAKGYKAIYDAMGI
jgi:hypothetical protein